MGREAREGRVSGRVTLARGAQVIYRAVGLVPLVSKCGADLPLPRQPVLDDRAGRAALRIDGRELVVEVEEALAQRRAGIGEAHPAFPAGEAEVLHVQGCRVRRAGLDHLPRVLE